MNPFYTHFAALCTQRALTGAGIGSKRAFSSSCGTRAAFEADGARVQLVRRDFEQVAVENADGTCEGAPFS
jgi:hypothetical protein